MSGDIFRNIASVPHIRNGNLHGKQAVVIVTENFPVHEVAPAADGLSQDKAGHGGVPHEQRILFLDPAPHKQRDKRRDDSAVYRHTAAAQTKDTEQIVLVIIPGKDHIINPCPNYGKNHRPNRKIPIVILILPRLFCDLYCRQQTRYNPDADDETVKGNLKAEHAERPGHIFQIDSQIWECNFTNIHRHLISGPLRGRLVSFLATH